MLEIPPVHTACDPVVEQRGLPLMQSPQIDSANLLRARLIMLTTHISFGQGDLAWEVRSSQAEGRLTLGLAGAGPEYL